MQLSTVKRGDLVRVDKRGRPFYAVAGDREGRDLEVYPITAGITYRSATAREVVGHWRRSKATPDPVAAQR